jgi:methylmalonyl-CoA mutase cobalamin-binding subunit
MSMPPLTQFKRFDVRALIQQGVEPFPEIHKRVHALGSEDGLIVAAPFLPSPLVEKLAGDGFDSKVERGTGSDWLVYFWRKAD